jgi:methyl-accepting chemotaxis protein
MLVGFILALVIGRVTGNTIVNPLAGLTTAAEKLARNDTSIEVPHRNRTDEVGLLARAMETFKQGLIERARLQEEAKAAEEAQRVAEAQRNAEERARDAEATRIREERTSRMEALVGDFDQSVRAILDVVASAATELEATSGGMARLAETAARDVSEATGESRAAAGNVDAVASASEEMARSVREITTQVHRSTERTREAMAAAAAATETVTTLHEDVGRIASVLSLINDIAEQTNLLALNATIEAARAGDAGKGFAVVAAEVKSLANETAKATGNIEAQMGSIQALSDQMAQAVKTIQAVVEDTESIAQGIAAAVEQQDAATAEIARSAQGAAQSTAVASANIEQVARGTAETQAAATQVLGASQELARNGVSMQGVVDDFLRAVRAV